MGTTSTETALANKLQAARSAGAGAPQTALAKLRSESLEARRDRIAEALSRGEGIGGPAELVATYPHHALADKDGTLIRVRVTEDASGITFDKVEVFSLPTPTTNVGAEVMETALLAADRILDGKFTEATPMVASIANALHASGDLQRQIATEVARRSVSRNAWWHKTVAEHAEAVLGAKLEPYEARTVTSPAALASAVATLRDELAEAAGRTAKAAKRLAEMADFMGGAPIPDVLMSAVTDIATDFKYAITALDGANHEEPAELQGVYEGIGAIAGHLLRGAAFVGALAPEPTAS